MEKTLETSTRSVIATSENPTTSERKSALKRCARCENFCPPEGALRGLYRSWLASYCASCKIQVEDEWKKQEEERIAEVRSREAAERERRRVDAQTVACGGTDPWERYKFDTYQPNLHPSFRDWFNYARKFPVEAKNLFVYGPTGVGKTHLCVSIGRSLWEKNGTFRWVHVDELIGEVFGTNRVSKAEKLSRLTELAKIDCLVIDELHVIDNQRHIDALQFLFDKRQRNGKFGLISIANVSLRGIADTVGMPLANRMDDRTFEIYCIPENTPSARGILKQQMRQK